MTSGWTCPRCSNVMAPFISCCPFCAKTARSPVPVAVPGTPGPLPGPFAMTVGAEYRFMAAGEWAEVFPGLQVRMNRAVWACSPDGEPTAAELDFRRPP
jgi:hypothetical protein